MVTYLISTKTQAGVQTLVQIQGTNETVQLINSLTILKSENTVCNIPQVEARKLILVRGKGKPMYFSFFHALCKKEYYSFPQSAGKNNFPARRNARRCQVYKFLTLV